MFVERKDCYSALFTNLVRWHAGAVSFPLSDVILAQLACPLGGMFCLRSEITNLSFYKHCIYVTTKITTKNIPCLNHRDKTRVQMLAKIFPHLKVKCKLFMGPTLGFETEQRNSFWIKFGGDGKTTYTFSVSMNAFSVEFPLACYQQAGRVWYVSGALQRTYTLFYPAPKFGVFLQLKQDSENIIHC
jgi:hypothetical protein